ncbi:MAG: sensor histidine kinase [Bacteroidota bacterium]
MQLYTIISLILALVSLQAGVIVLLNNIALKLNRIFFFNALFFALWSFGLAMISISSNEALLEFWFKFSSLSWIAFYATIIIFVVNFIEIKFLYSKETTIGVLLFLSVFIMYSIILDLVDVRPVFIAKEGLYVIKLSNNIINIIYYANYFLCILISLVLLIIWKVRREEKALRFQRNMLVVALMLFLLFSLHYDFIYLYVFDAGKSIASHFVAIIWICIAAYVVLNHKFIQGTKKVATETILKSMNKFLVFVDTRFYVSNINAYSLSIIESDKKEIVGTYFPDFFLNRELLILYLKKALKGENVYDAEIELCYNKNVSIPLLLSFTLVKDSFGDKLGIAVFGEDNREFVMLKKEVQYREDVEKKLNKVKEALNLRVKKRTNELINSYKELQIKITERMKVEEEIKGDITEKETLISEILYRVKSNMQMIIALMDSQVDKQISDRALIKLKELSFRVKSMLLVHEYLYLSISYSYVDFASFIRHLVDELAAFYKKENLINIKLNISDVYLNIDFAIPLGIIMNELISNALSHGFPNEFLNNNNPDFSPEISVSYRYENGQYEIIIADNGIGLPNKNVLDKKRTIGLQLVQVLVNEQISGMFYISSKYKKTMISIVFDDEKTN